MINEYKRNTAHKTEARKGGGRDRTLGGWLWNGLSPQGGAIKTPHFKVLRRLQIKKENTKLKRRSHRKYLVSKERSVYVMHILCICVCIKAVIIWGRVNVMGSRDRIAFVFLRDVFHSWTLVIQILNIFIRYSIHLIPIRSFLETSEVWPCKHQNDGLRLLFFNPFSFYTDSLHTKGIYLKTTSAPLGETWSLQGLKCSWLLWELGVWKVGKWILGE